MRCHCRLTDVKRIRGWKEGLVALRGCLKGMAFTTRVPPLRSTGGQAEPQKRMQSWRVLEIEQRREGGLTITHRGHWMSIMDKGGGRLHRPSTYPVIRKNDDSL